MASPVKFLPKLAAVLPGRARLLLTAAFAFFFWSASVATQKPSANEKYFFDSANEDRLAMHLPALKWDEALAEAARRHARLMAEQNRFGHQLPGELRLSERAGLAGARFSRVGENIAIGGEAPEIHDGWMQSPGHRANILDAHFTALGVGVIEHDDKLYAVEDFSVAVESLDLKAQEQELTALLRAKGVQVTNESETARQACADDSIGRRSGRTLILWYQVSDLRALPDAVISKMRRGGYARVAVGACTPKGSSEGFTRFRIALVLS